MARRRRLFLSLGREPEKRKVGVEETVAKMPTRVYI